jgi:hypothetical protein
MTGTLDGVARARLGLDANRTITGPVQVKVGGRVALNGDGDSRPSVEADFAQVKLDDPLPGWIKPENRPARAKYTFVGRSRPTKLEDIAFDGNGATLRGSVEFDQNGNLAIGMFPVFGPA